MSNFFADFNDIFLKEHKRFLDELVEFLAIPSISTDSQFNDQSIKCANWLKDHLKNLGASFCKLIPTTTDGVPGLPAVYAFFTASAGYQNPKTLLFYGHYDVQPVEPLELWSTDPFKAVFKDNRIYARGAQDNKGQLFYFIKALDVCLKNNKLAFNVKVLIEGQEECGSVGISKILPTIANEIKADELLVCDTGTLNKSLGAVTMGLRGILHLEFKLTGPSKDLHSGVHGGLVKNPAVELCRMVAKLHQDDGSIAIKDFYEGILELDPEDKQKALQFPISDDEYQTLVGIKPTGGEQAIPAPIRRGLRPTIEVNGITSGYQGEGSKTIIPSWASAKISCRIVKGQSSQKCLNLVVEFLKEIAPKDLKLEFLHTDASGEGFSVSSKAQTVKKASLILKELTSSEPLYIWEGASIPLIPALIESSQACPLLVGFGLEEDNIHAPNESFDLDQWKKGFLFCAKYLSLEN